LVQPDCFLKETKKYRDSEDLLKEFIDEYCDVDPDLVSYSSELFAAFLSWYELEISSKGCSQRFFGLLMGKKFNKCREKGTGLTVYEGVKLKEK
jgi:phage/plasmid-associated DNA primase